ncbi:MAG TPA: glutathione S-transferase family protein [Marinobacterium sp.]|nr:glutathione S-transferase family protein [Marinobacterium sp.]
MSEYTLYHIPICPFSQRIEILLELRGMRDRVRFEVIDITKPRPEWLIKKTGRAVPLPILELPDGRVLRESMAILQYLDEVLPGRSLRAEDSFTHAKEKILIGRAESYTMDGYMMVMNQDPERKSEFEKRMLSHYSELNRLLNEFGEGETFFLKDFGLVEAVFTPMRMRFWFLDYYEQFQLPDTDEYARVTRWLDACLRHPAAQQVKFDQIVKLYYDYAKGWGNGALPDGRSVSSFTFDSDWKNRPLPPQDKYSYSASDTELGLV